MTNRISKKVIKLRESNYLDLQTQIESITRKWWFYLILLILQMLPPFTSVPISSEQAGLIIGAALSQAIVYDIAALFPLFKILAILMIASVFFLKRQVSRYFSFYVGTFYILVAFLQSIAFTEEFGLVIITTNLLMFLFVGSLWFWEAVVRRNDFSTAHFDKSRIWIIPLAILAFWYPIDGVTMMPDFNPALLITNEAGLTYCMMTPVFLTILILFYPHINTATFRVTSFVGLIIGFYNILSNFLIYPELLIWNGFLHIPLMIISIYAFILSLRKSDSTISEIAPEEGVVEEK